MAAKKKAADSLPSFANSKARHKFLLSDNFVAGIQLNGTEVKSIRNGKAQISESFARFDKDELFLYNAYIDEYPFGNDNNHEPTRPRKLLLHRRELERLQAVVEAAGKTIVPLKLFFKGALIKCELAVGTGKNQRDKRQDLKKRDAKREAEQAIKNSLKRWSILFSFNQKSLKTPETSEDFALLSRPGYTLSTPLALKLPTKT